MLKDTSTPIPELGGRTWSDLEVVEHGDSTLLFKDALRKRGATGQVEMVPVRIKIIRNLEIAEARAKCSAWCLKLKIERDKDKDIFDALEQVCILALAIRSPVAPYPQLFDAEELATKFDEVCLQDVLGRIEALRAMMDVRESDITPDVIWSKIFAVAKAGHLLPLTDIASHAQPSCIVFMACQALKSPTGLAWLQSQGISTPEQSAEMSSNESSQGAE
jgi:hypothetical protein